MNSSNWILWRVSVPERTKTRSTDTYYINYIYYYANVVKVYEDCIKFKNTESAGRRKTSFPKE